MLAFLTFYFFWHRAGVHVIIGFALMMVTIVVLERVVHTTYTITDEGCLEIYRGRWSKLQRIPLSDIVSMEIRKSPLGLTRYVLIEYGANHFVSVQPDNEENFIQEIRKRLKRHEN